MFSMPPATTTLASPAVIMPAPSITALSPLPQTLLMPTAPTLGGRPAAMAAWRAGAWPMPAEITFPMSTSSMLPPSSPERSTAARMAIPPSSGAGIAERAPWNFPMAVRAALMMTA
jgi:hypothetical protein